MFGFKINLHLFFSYCPYQYLYFSQNILYNRLSIQQNCIILHNANYSGNYTRFASLISLLRFSLSNCLHRKKKDKKEKRKRRKEGKWIDNGNWIWSSTRFPIGGQFSTWRKWEKMGEGREGGGGGSYCASRARCFSSVQGPSSLLFLFFRANLSFVYSQL